MPSPQEDKDFQFSDSDLTLISADNISYKIHKHRLQASSSVFQNMVEAGSANATLELTDKELESSKIVSLFLRIVYGRALVPAKDLTELTNVHQNLAQFLVKYECSTPIEHLCTCFKLWMVDSPFVVYRYLLIASQLDRPDLFAATLRQGNGGKWEPLKSSVTPSTRTCGLVGGQGLDISSAPFEAFTLIPHHFLFAYLRAQRIILGSLDAKTDWKAFADEFDKVIKDLEDQAGS